MKRSLFAVTMHYAAFLSSLLMVLFASLHHFLVCPVLLTLAITFGTTCYHFAMRLLVGALVPKGFDYRKRWFQPTKFEPVLYKALRLKKWKMQLPTYNPSLFSLQENTLEQILCNMCQAEVVHEIIIVLSFLPLLFSLVWDSFFVFLATSILAANFDLLFVILQRFNRPRIIKLLRRNTR